MMAENNSGNPQSEEQSRWIKKENLGATSKTILDNAQQNRLEVEAIEKTKAIIFDPKLTRNYSDIVTQDDALLFLDEVFGTSYGELPHQEYLWCKTNYGL